LQGGEGKRDQRRTGRSFFQLKPKTDLGSAAWEANLLEAGALAEERMAGAARRTEDRRKADMTLDRNGKKMEVKEEARLLSAREIQQRRLNQHANHHHRLVHQLSSRSRTSTRIISRKRHPHQQRPSGEDARRSRRASKPYFRCLRTIRTHELTP
jgi:hypothetical protein